MGMATRMAIGALATAVTIRIIAALITAIIVPTIDMARIADIGSRF
jgi:hypothetical protein